MMKSCRACGDTEVIRWTYATDDPSKEGVVAECKSCGNRRGSWERKRKTEVK